jgi:hypothetical protein
MLWNVSPGQDVVSRPALRHRMDRAGVKKLRVLTAQRRQLAQFQNSTKGPARKI